MNKLYFGDNLNILRDNIKDETVDLIYLDPPFNSKRDYNLLFKTSFLIFSLLLLFSCNGYEHTTVCRENRLNPFQDLGAKVQFTAILYDYKYENGKDGDLDYHLNLKDSKCYMIAEIMPRDDNALSEFAALRKKWKSPDDGAGINFKPKRVTITGIRYYDHEHGQNGNAVNNVEIHPLLSITEVNLE